MIRSSHNISTCVGSRWQTITLELGCGVRTVLWILERLCMCDYVHPIVDAVSGMVKGCIKPNSTLWTPILISM